MQHIACDASRRAPRALQVNVHRMVYANSAFGNTTGEANVGNDQTVAIRQRAALESLFYAGGTENHVDAVFYGARAHPGARAPRTRPGRLIPWTS